MITLISLMKKVELIDEMLPLGIQNLAGAIIIDDPIKPDDALSDQKREAVNNKFDTTIPKPYLIVVILR